MRPSSLKKRSPLFGGSARRTSPRKDQGTRSTFCRQLRQYSIFIVLWLVLVPFIWSTLQWSIDDSIYRGNHPSMETSERTDMAEPTNAPTTQSKETPEAKERPPLQPDDRINEPLIPTSLYQPSSTNPLQVVFIGSYRMKVKADGETDGQFQVMGNMLESLQLSKYIRVVTCLLYNHASIDVQLQEFMAVTSSAPVIFIVDWWALERDCHILNRVLQHTPYQAGDKLILVDTSASPSIRSCEQKSQMVKSSLVQNRRWDFAHHWVVKGERVASTSGASQMTGYVAELFVEQLREFEGSKRISDVVHYWSSATIDNDIPHLQYSALRRTVSSQIKDTHNHLSKEYELGPWIDEIGIKSTNRSEEFDVLEETARELSSAKIVVVAQSDEWEFVDNRLMEALASGALVLADEMLAPPPGLSNKTNIVFYDSSKSLDTLIEYYLQNESKRKEIGRRGRQYSLGRHRSWHVFEQLLFGKAMTRTNKGLAANPAKPIAFDNSTSDIIQLV